MTPPLPLRLILASQSRRRRELAISAGWDVSIIAPPEQAEASALPHQPGDTVRDFVTRLAHPKASAVAKHLPLSEDRAILACDTVVTQQQKGVHQVKFSWTHSTKKRLICT